MGITKKIVISSIMLLLSSLAFISATMNLIGIKGSIKIGIMIILIISLISFTYYFFKHKGINIQNPKNITYDKFLRENIYSSNKIVLMGSGGDQTRLFMATLNKNKSFTKNLKVMMFLRDRKGETTITKNINQIKKFSLKLDFEFKVFITDWEIFNLSAVVCDNKKAILNFYTRNQTETFRVWSDYKLIEKNKNKLHDDLFLIIEMWMENCQFRYVELETI